MTEKVSELTSAFVYEAYHLSDQMPFSLQTVPALDLINSQRLDIMAKMLYLSLKEKAPVYAEKLYLEHIRVMTRDSFAEAGSSKMGKEAFIRSFNCLYENMKKDGYSEKELPIPVDRNMHPMDGAHRIACAALLNIPVKIIQLPVDAVYDRYPYTWFLERGMNIDYLDHMVREYIKTKRNCACINVWPSAKGHDEELENLLTQKFGILYKKNISLNENGAFHYLAQIYREYSWAQDHDGDGFSGVYRKLVPCFPTFDPVRVYFVETDDYSEVTLAKEELRGLYGLEKHSLHATDNQEETEAMSELLLNSCTVSFMNRCKSTRFSNTFDLLKESDGFDFDKTVLTGSIVLALYGIRQAEDLDFLSVEDIPGSHNNLQKYYGITPSEAVNDPENYFVYFGKKFMTLERIRDFKKSRNESKDRDDLVLIDAVMKNQDKPDLKVILLQKKRRTVAAVQGVILRTAHRTGTYDLLRAIYKKVKGKGE